MRKIFKGYQVAGDNNLTKAVFKSFKSFESLESFLQEEETFREWLEEMGMDITELSEKMFESYNEGDELKSYYSFENKDNTKELLSMYKTDSIEEGVKLHNEYTALLVEVESYSDYNNEWDKIRHNNAREELVSFEERWLK